MNTPTKTISDIKLIGEKALRRSPEIEMERHRALSDLLHQNFFIVHGFEDETPYKIELEIIQRTLNITVKNGSPTFPMPIYAARPSTAALWTNGTTCAAESIDTCRV